MPGYFEKQNVRRVTSTHDSINEKREEEMSSPKQKQHLITLERRGVEQRALHRRKSFE
ncbi:hypothetical protein [Bacillus sp. JCM 19034]|uniref:hypothetical protein n=1 Tax=Bacillus sp. JCM 19034 TaxID=1481928 RepID=UPI0012E0E189|nr:hypothetical protein [Bacillus sp. JCM 19034]